MPCGSAATASVALLLLVATVATASDAGAATSNMEALALPPAHNTAAGHPLSGSPGQAPPAFTPAPPNSNMCFGYNISDRVCCGFRYAANGQMEILTCPAGYVCGVNDGVCIRPMQPGAVMGHFGFIAIALCLSLCCLLVCGVTRCCSRIALSLHTRRVDRDRAGLLAPTDFSDTDDEDGTRQHGVTIVSAAARRRRRARVVPAVVVDSQSPIDGTVAVNADEPPPPCPYGPSAATGYATVQPTSEEAQEVSADTTAAGVGAEVTTASSTDDE